ncbi:hypothetical protein QBK99_20200 [Corticibacterium sp. UT-5YL-CI-8]|nr:hypothetical protein [Tianweitania sp. UT-5YL-CI-8]
MAIIVFVAFEKGIHPGYIICGDDVEMSLALQSRNVAAAFQRAGRGKLEMRQ